MQILWFSLVRDELTLLWTNDGNGMKSQSPILGTPGIRSSRRTFCNCQIMYISLLLITSSFTLPLR